jgi:hypothetical protein
MFQNSVTNGASNVQALPNGTSNVAGFLAFANSDPANTNFVQIAAVGLDARVSSGITGTGSFAPMTFYTGGGERMRVDTSGRVGIGTSTPSTNAILTTNGNIAVAIPTRNAASTNQIGVWTSDDPADNSRANITFATTAGASSSNSYIAFSTNNYGVSGGERMRIDSAGNVGVGTSSPSRTLDINTPSATFRVRDSLGGNDFSIKNIAGPVSLAGSVANTAIGFMTNDTERARIDSSGNVGIGTTSPLAQIHATTAVLVSGDGGYYGGQAYFASGAWRNAVNSQGGYAIRNTGGVFTVWTGASSSTAGTAFADFNERVRIDSSGNLLVGTTVASDATIVGVTLGGGGSNFTTSNVGTQFPCAFRRGGNLVGTISTSTTATAYNTSSDYRLKENAQPMTGALAKVAALKPCTYTWKADGSDGEGFIAHELAEVVPQCVTGEKDAVDSEGKPVYQGIDTSFLVATLTAAIQELKAELDATKAEVAALKGQA